MEVDSATTTRDVVVVAVDMEVVVAQVPIDAGWDGNIREQFWLRLDFSGWSVVVFRAFWEAY